MIKLFLITALLCCCTSAFSLSVMGSHLEWQAVPGVNDKYKVRLTLYLDATSGELEQSQQYIYLFKNDRHWEAVQQWLYFGLFYLNKVSSQEIGQDTLACAGTGPWEDFEGQRHVYLSVYENTIQVPLLPSLPSETGFIVAWHPVGSRDGKDKNVTNSVGSFEWVTTFIPPTAINGVNLENSSPVLGQVNTFFVCRDDRVSIQLPAVDSDGDILKYKSMKPYIVMAGRDVTEDHITVVDLIWGNGYNEQTQVHGNAGLRINESTGEMTVNADEEGQYFIGISVEEYRNGQKIGSVSFYYTLTVLDCNNQQNWDKNIYKDTTAVQSLTICEGSETTLASKQSFPNPEPQFQWTRNGKTIWGANAQTITIREEGNYQLLVTKINGCPDAFKSETVHVSVASSIGAEIDSISPICDINEPPVALHAKPFGGTFAGPGVAENTFDPRIAGVGRHEVEYRIQSSDDCPAMVARREVVVSELPQIELTEVVYTSPGKPIAIGVKDSLNLAYCWTPPDYLNNATFANPISTLADGMIYTVTATNAYGCAVSRKVQIRIIQNIGIPDAFTPDSDGINETWELKGIEAYTDCHVTIYNRWGEVIFNSVGYKDPFDGTVDGRLQMPGVYAYKIRLSESSPELTGAFMIIR